MSKCRPIAETLRMKKAQGWSNSALVKLREYLKESRGLAIVESARIGKIGWAVTNTEEVDSGLGIAVQSRADTEYKTGNFLTRVVNQDDMVVLELGKIGTVQETKLAVAKADPIVNLRGVESFDDLKQALIAAGYDAVTSGENMVVVDTGKVSIDTKPIVEYVDEDDMNTGYDMPIVTGRLPLDEDIDLRDTATLVKSVYGNSLPIRWKGTAAVTNAHILDAELSDGVLTVYTSRGKFVFRQGSEESVPNKQGVFVKVAGIGQVLHDASSYDGYVLGSSNSGAIGTAEVTDVQGDTAKMVDFMKKLNNVSGAKVDNEFMTYLENLVGEMDTNFFTEMKLYLDTMASETKGQVTTESKLVPSADDRIDIQVSRLQHAGNDQSGAEVYAHEVVHAYTLWALNMTGRVADDLRRQIRHLRDVTEKALKDKYKGEGWKVFMPEASIDSALEEKAAKETWKYVFENSDKNATAEFVAYMTTNPMLVRAAKEIALREEGQKPKNVFEWVTKALSKIMEVLGGRLRALSKNKDVQSEMLDLVFELGKINNRAQVRINESISAVDKVMEWFDDVDERLGDRLAKAFNKRAKKLLLNVTPMPVGKGKLALAKWVASNLAAMMTNPELRSSIVMLLKGLKMSPTGIVQNILRDLQSSDALKIAIHEQMRMAGKIDRIREAIAKSYTDSIVGGFSVKLTKEQDEAITKVMIDTDMQALLGSYSVKELEQMLNDDKVLEKAIETAKSQVSGLHKQQANWNIAQAEGLGYFMVTGEANEAQNMNAESIASGVLQFDDRREPKKGEVDAIDKLASLYALKYTDKYAKARVAALMRTEQKGIENVIANHKFFIEDSKKELFDGSQKLMIKGYSREIFNDSIAVEVAPSADEVSMKAKGYKKIKDLEIDTALSSQQMALYKSEAFNRQEYYRTTVKLTGIGRKGTSLMQVALNNFGERGLHMAKMAKKRADIARKKLVLEMERGTYKIKDAPLGKVPVIDPEGNVIDYRYLMNKRDKVQVLEQEIEASKVLGRSLATVYDRVSTEQHNENVLKLILDDMDVNYVKNDILGNNGYTYLEIGQNVISAKGRELWKMMPEAMRRSVQEKDYQYIAVREDMVEEYFGFRHLSAADNAIVKFFPQIVRTAIKVIEEIWQSIVAIAKIDILIRTPFVIIGNIINNMVYGIQTGSSPAEIIKMYVSQMRNIVEYMKKHKELLELEAAMNSGNILGKDVARIEVLRSALEENPVHELFETGIYESVVEDLNEGEAKEKGILAGWMQEKTKNSPEWVKTGWNWFTLNRHTAWYKNMEMMLRMGDLVGQAVENEKRKVKNDIVLTKMETALVKEGKPRGQINQLVAKEKRRLDAKRLAELNEEFIFYSAPASALEEYANRMGLVMFTKFYKRYQKVLMKSAINRPLRTLMLVGVDEFLFDDQLETPVDQSVFDKMLDGRAMNMFQNPINLMHRNMPFGLRFATGTL